IQPDDPGLIDAEVVLDLDQGRVLYDVCVGDEVAFAVDQESGAAGGKGGDFGGGGVDLIGKIVQPGVGGLQAAIEQLDVFFTDLGGQGGDQAADAQGGDAGDGCGDADDAFVLIPQRYHFGGAGPFDLAFTGELLVDVLQLGLQVINFSVLGELLEEKGVFD